MKLITAKSYLDLSRKAAAIIASQLTLWPNSVFGLATGSTPIGTYKQLIEWYKKGDVDFSNAKSINLDEYCGLGENDDQSYRYFMNTNLFDHVNIDKKNTNVPDGLAVDYDKECKRYEKLIDELGGIDIQVLGLGHNGHIAFNEPDSAFPQCTHCVALKESTIQANARFFDSADKVPKKALSMGIGSIMKAKKVLLLVSGREKKDILSEALTGPVTPDVPASILQFHPDLTVIGYEVF